MIRVISEKPNKPPMKKKMDRIYTIIRIE